MNKFFWIALRLSRLSKFIFMAVLVSLPTVSMSAFTNEIKLLASDAASLDGFGWSVGVSGDTAIVGALDANAATGTNSGAAYIFTRNSVSGVWTEQQVLVSAAPESGAQFGQSVAISQDYAIVGAKFEDSPTVSSGAAYLFERNPGTGEWERQTIQGSDTFVSDNFGGAVAIDGDTAVVGAIGADGNAGQSGAAYVFVRNGSTGVWDEQAKLFSADGVFGDRFGNAVSIDGDTVVIGADGDDDGASQTGSAYVFVRNPSTGSWTEQAKLVASDGTLLDLFGKKVTVSGDIALIGAPDEDDPNDVGNIDVGAVYFFERNPIDGVWSQTQKLFGSNKELEGQFGSAIAIDGDTAAVGAFGDGASNTNRGAVFVFVRNSSTGVWSEDEKLVSSDQANFDGFGLSTALSGNTLLVGAPGDDVVPFDSGAAYVYTSSSITAADIQVTDSTAPTTDLVVAFGDVTEFTNVTQTVTVSNAGTADLTLGNVAGSNALVSPFSIVTDNCSAQVLTPASSCTISVGFAPGSIGSFSDSFDIPSDDADENPVTVTVNGNGVGVPVADIQVTDAVAPIDDLQVGFGNVTQLSTADQVVTVTNTGNANLSIGSIAQSNALAAPFSVVTDNCSSQSLSPASSCTLTVRFSPTVTGSASDSFDIPSDDPDESSVTVNLNGTGAQLTVPDISVTDSTAPTTDLVVAFGDVTEFTNITQTVTVSNAGTADLTLGNVAGSNALVSPFSIVTDNCSAQVLTPASSCTISVGFAPGSIGSFSDSFDIPSDDADENPVTVTVNGNGVGVPVADIQVTDAVAPIDDLQVGFGNVTQLSTADQVVTVTNTGNANLSIGSIAQSNALAAPFSVVTDNCSSQSLSPASSCTLTVRFSPTVTGSASDSFDIPSDDPDEGSVTVNLNGTGAQLTVPDISVTDSTAPTTDLVVAFGDVTEFTNVTQTVTVSNAGTADLTLGNVAGSNALVSPFSIVTDNCSAQVLTPASSCTISVGFAPGSIGSFSDSFDIPSDDADENPVTVTVNGNGVGVPVADIQVTDAVAPIDDLQVGFGNVTQLSTADQVVTVTNTGNANLSIGSIAQSNALAAPFSVVTDNCSSQSLSPASSCTLTVRFSPTVTGSASDSFDIPSDDPDESSVTVNLNGTGAQLTVPDISVTDSTAPTADLLVAFGDVTLSSTSDQQITITNEGNASLIIGNVAVANALTAPFSVVGDTCSGQSVSPASNCNFTVRFAPVTTGSFSDSLDIPSNDADEAVVTLNISGQGIEASNPPGGSTNTPTSGGGGSLSLDWLGLLGLIGLLMRVRSLSSLMPRGWSGQR